MRYFYNNIKYVLHAFDFRYICFYSIFGVLLWFVQNLYRLSIYFRLFSFIVLLVVIKFISVGLCLLVSLLVLIMFLPVYGITLYFQFEKGSRGDQTRVFAVAGIVLYKFLI